MLTPATMGWMAGIIDLKGKIYVKKNNQRQEGSQQIVLMVESRYLGIIRRLGELVGTRPEVMQAKPLKDFMRRGCTDHCPEGHIHVNDDRIMPGVYRWTITGMALAVVLDALDPILIEDKGYEEFKAEILAQAALSGQGSGAVMASLNRLRLLGWPMPEAVTRELQRRETALAILVGGGEGHEQES